MSFINDTEENLRGILSLCRDAGVRGVVCFGMGTTLREEDREYFYDALDRRFPGLKQKYAQKYGYTFACESDNSPALMQLFRTKCGAHGIMHNTGQIFEYLHEFPQNSAQLTLF